MAWPPPPLSRNAAVSRPRVGGLTPWLLAACAMHAVLIVALTDFRERSRPMRNDRAPASANSPAPIWFELVEENEGASANASPSSPSPDGSNTDRGLPVAVAPAAGDRHALVAGAARVAAERRPGAITEASAEVLASASEGASPSARAPGGGAETGAAESDQAEPASGSAGPQLSLRDLGVGPGANPFIGSANELPTARQVYNQRLRRTLRADLARHDQSIGLGPEGPAVAAVKEIVMQSATAPNTSALLRVRTDATGKVTLVDVLDADRDDQEWRRIADQLRVALAGKHLRVPPRSGVSFQLRVVSRVQLPSGADPGLEVDLFGIPLKKGAGDRSTKIAVLSPMLTEVTIPGSDGATMRVPTLALIGGAGDLADVGGVARRLVTAYLVAMDADAPSEAPAVEIRPPAVRAPGGP
jgi:hypothetical protein